MKWEFRFNGANSLTLLPENQREKDLIRLFSEGYKQLKFGASTGSAPEALVIIAEADQKPAVYKEQEN